MRRGTKLSLVLLAAGAVALLAWGLGSRIESPAEAAARTAPPPPSPILVPIERRVLSSTIVTRGTGRFGTPQKLSVAPSALKPGPGLISTVPLRNAQLAEGAVLLVASGRPLFILQGAVPAYRDLAPGTQGEDVRQLERALARMGFDPGPVDGVYDGRTADAVARWYTARQWQPFGPTREQLAAAAALEREAADAQRARQQAQAALSGAALTVESARATADHAAKVASSEQVLRQAESRRLRGGEQASLLQEAERVKAAHAERAAEADLQAAFAERALIVLDPRQPGTARAAADAKLELARAALDKVRVEGRMAMQAVEREARQAAVQADVAESASRAAQVEGRKQVQAAIDAQRLAELELRTTTERAQRLAADLSAARQRLGVQVPLDEVIFVAALPVRVEEVSVLVGAAASGPVVAVTDNRLMIDASLTLDTAQLVRPGMPVAIDEADLGIKAKGLVEQVASTPGTRGVDGYHVYFEVRVTEAAGKLDGVSMRLTIPTESTRGEVLAVPTSALNLSADGSSRVQVMDKTGPRWVVVQPGLSTGGFVEVTPVQGTLAAGQQVVVGYKTEAAKEGP